MTLQLLRVKTDGSAAFPFRGRRQWFPRPFEVPHSFRRIHNGLHDRCRLQTIRKDLTSDRDLIKVATSALNACLTEAQKARQIISKTNNIVKN